MLRVAITALTCVNPDISTLALKHYLPSNKWLKRHPRPVNRLTLYNEEADAEIRQLLLPSIPSVMILLENLSQFGQGAVLQRFDRTHRLAQHVGCCFVVQSLDEL